MQLKRPFKEIREEALHMLKENLPSGLSYHNYEHTLDVVHAAERIAQAEDISGEDLEVLRMAAVLHDSGYINTRHEHEEESCRITQKLLTANGIDSSFIDKVCDLIRATKVPQEPKDKLCEILCDADLDYLGRDDFFEISHKVYSEFRKFGIVKDETEWNDLQIRFFESHRYFTSSAKKMRLDKKNEHLATLKKMKIVN